MGIPWFMYPIVVTFGDTNVDKALYASHDMDFAAPANTPVTALVPGTISSLTAPMWGKQVGVKMDTPVNNVDYCAYLHLAAVNPQLTVGHHVNTGDLLGWVGGGTSPDMYAGTSNPTGENFLNNTFNSSRIQAGFALCYGPEYGGVGWVNFPPIDWNLNPSSIVTRAREAYVMATSITKAAYDTWNSTSHLFAGTPPPLNTGIALEWMTKYKSGVVMPPPLTYEFQSVDWAGNPIVVQEFVGIRCEDNQGTKKWYKMSGGLF